MLLSWTQIRSGPFFEAKKTRAALSIKSCPCCENDWTAEYITVWIFHRVPTDTLAIHTRKTVSLDYWSTLFMRWFAFSKVLYDDDRARAQKEIATHKKRGKESRSNLSKLFSWIFCLVLCIQIHTIKIMRLKLCMWVLNLNREQGKQMSCFVDSSAVI